jgi:hypothetical protein
MTVMFQKRQKWGLAGPLGLIGDPKVSRLSEILGLQGFLGVPLSTIVPGPLEVAGSSSVTRPNGF